MKSICEALLGRKETETGGVGMDFDVERELERQAEQQLDRDCIAEIDRYRRMDEWTSSFQNIFSRTAIECQRRFMQANVIDLDIMQFLQYTRAGTYEMLRLDAFKILIDFDIFQNPELLTWFIYVMSADPSPWIRHNLHIAFGRGLAPIAFGERNVEKQPEPANNLIIEQESSTEVRQANLARKQTVPGALEALKRELEGNTTLKEALWAACNSPIVGLAEICDFVDICSVIYHPIDKMMVVLKYPRYWKLENRGHVRQSSPPLPTVSADFIIGHMRINTIKKQGKLRFFKGGRFRTSLVAKGAAATPAPNGALKRKREEGAPPLSHKLTLKVPKLSLTSSPANSQPTPPTTMPKLKLKFKPAGSSMSPH